MRNRVDMIAIFVTGGTFDKTYDEIGGRLAFADTHLPEMLRLGRCHLDVSVRTVMMVDSLEMTDADRAALDRDGVWMRPSEYGDPYPIARRFLEESAGWNLLPGPVGIDLPVRILQGAADPDVPWRHALALAGALTSQDLVFSLVRDGDHRLSRPQDIDRLLAFVDELCG